MPKNYLSEMTPDQVGELLKKQVSKAIEIAQRKILSRDFSVKTTMITLESEIHRILSGEMIYPLT